MPTPRARSALLLAIPLVAIPLLFALPLFAGQVLLFRDLIHFHGPEGFLLAKALRAGHLPLWNPLFYGGTPFLAEPGTGVFYPPAWLFLCLDPWRALTVFALIHLPAAAFGTWLLARRLGLSREASALAATAYVCSGYLLSMNGGYFNLSAPALLPLATALLLDAADRPSARRTALGAFALAWLVFNGEPQGVFLAVLFAAALACAPPRSLAPQSLLQQPLSLAHQPSPGFKRVLGFGLALLLGAALGAVQLIPAALLTRHSTRAHGLPLAEAQSWSLHPLRLLELFVPQPFGLSYPDNGFWGSALLDASRRAPWAASLFLGPLVPIFALATPRAAWRGRTLALGAIAAAAFLLAFGAHTPLFAIFFRAFPLADRLRYPERYAAAATLALVLLGAMRIDALLQGAHARVDAWLCGLAAAIFASAGALALTKPAWLLRAIEAGLRASSANVAPPAANEALGFALLEAALLCAAGLLALALLRPGRASPSPLFFPLVFALVALPLVDNGFALLSYGSAAALHGEPPLATAIRQAIPPGSAGRFLAEGDCLPEPGPAPLLERVRAEQYQMGHGNLFALFGLRNALGYGSLEDPEQIAWVHALHPLGDDALARALGAAVRFGCDRGRPWMKPVDHPLSRARIASAIAAPASLEAAARAVVEQGAAGESHRARRCERTRANSVRDRARQRRDSRRRRRARRRPHRRRRRTARPRRSLPRGLVGDRRWQPGAAAPRRRALARGAGPGRRARGDLPLHRARPARGRDRLAGGAGDLRGLLRVATK